MQKRWGYLLSFVCIWRCFYKYTSFSTQEKGLLTCMVTVLFAIKKPPSSKVVSINFYENWGKMGYFWVPLPRKPFIYKGLLRKQQGSRPQGEVLICPSSSLWGALSIIHIILYATITYWPHQWKFDIFLLFAYILLHFTFRLMYDLM